MITLDGLSSCFSHHKDLDIVMDHTTSSSLISLENFSSLALKFLDVFHVFYVFGFTALHLFLYIQYDFSKKEFRR